MTSFSFDQNHSCCDIPVRLAQSSVHTAASHSFADIANAPAVQSLARRLEDGGALSFSAIAAPAWPFIAALIKRNFPQRPLVIVTENLRTQELFQQDLETWLNLSPQISSPLLFYPEWEVFPHESKLPHSDVISDRLQTLVTLLNVAQASKSAGRVNEKDAQSPIGSSTIITSVTALLQKTFTPHDLKTRARRMQRGDKIAPLDLIEWLEEQGYEPEAQVSQKGEIALRGGIVDIFPSAGPWPVRLEFFGDELESLREFDPLTQISRQEIPSVIIPPAGELGLLKRQPPDLSSSSSSSKAPKPGESTPSSNNQRHPNAVPSPLPSVHPSFSEGGSDGRGEGQGEVRARATGESFSSSNENLATLPDYLPKDAIFLYCAPEQLSIRADEYAANIPSDDPFFISWEDVQRKTEHFTTVALTESESENDSADTPQFQSLETFRPLGDYAGGPQIAEAQRREFFNQIHRWLRQDYSVHVFCNNDGERQRFEEIWRDFVGNESVPALQIGSLSRGFICDEAKLVVVTDAEIFGRYKIQRPRRLKSSHALAARSALDIDFTDLEEGDLVVHVQYGIGKFLGLKNLPASTGKQGETECLVIEYAPSGMEVEPPKLYVPVSEAHLVGKYVGAGKAHPPLNTLSGNRWRKAKEQAESAVRDVAAEMLRIQAARDTQEGHAFKPDSPWQREFENAFIYEETPDQLTAIAQTKVDMEKPRPMDRLICGDVGFGKTEVAIRAAFKSVMDGKQVAVLVPTTVLAQQHFNNFRERMADYPVRVELLSRFRTRREQQRVVKDLGAGGVDIVIGTHRILQNDIAFKDLGLVVIDEEQRFGVLHKEKFKRLRTLVDVLTLSATPIPRTLYLALTGARDMSTIQTPPHDRLPVQTIVTQYDERVIRDAIQRELNRGGQVFFLHNRVMTIEMMRGKLQMLLPNARIVVGHGQMDADELEEVMMKFVNGQADVLLSTTIIESGLDIPNANTIIIDRADRFGLSDLYQLRGRVGRYKHQAYAYLLMPRHASLLTDVRKRISAIRQYSTLGSGFKIAMRDLEIRGAGNLLGSEQSGHITAVGFELYCQLLKQSVSSLKGEKTKPRIEVAVKLDFIGNDQVETRPKPADDENARPFANHATLPHSYAPDPRHRIEIYRKLAQANEQSALKNLEKELRDRFGPPPPPVELLIQIAELKILAADKSVTAIEVTNDKLMLTRHNDFITLAGKFPRLTKKDAKGRLKEIKRLLLAL
ncbi:MAG TPA: transcription-repair coupling factor [Candidatus Sulfotelmatobacter sp.]|nr:transcription-repair coupling factor [Candidatus Sulfotelmatobacter sp.]